MLVRFSSVETESITMFGDSAIQLIKMLGASGTVPGAISAADIPAAIARLRQQLRALATDTQPAETTTDVDEDKDGDQQRQPPVALATRALPLLDLLERAAGKAPLMWEAVK